MSHSVKKKESYCLKFLHQVVFGSVVVTVITVHPEMLVFFLPI